MGMFEHLPYTNFHELNLDYLLREMKRLREDYERFKAEMVAKINEFILMVQQMRDEWAVFKEEIEELVAGWNTRITALESAMSDTEELVEQLRTEVAAMRISVDTINADVSELKIAVDGLETRMSAVEEIVSALMQYVLKTMVPVSDIVDSVTFGPVGDQYPNTCGLWHDGIYSAYSAYTRAEGDVYKILSFNLIATMPFDGGEPYIMLGGRDYELVVTLKNRYRLFDMPVKMRGCVAKVDMLDDNQQLTQARYLTVGGAAAYSLFALNNGSVEGDAIYSRTLRYKISPPADDFGIFGALRFTITDLSVIEDYDTE